LRFRRMEHCGDKFSQADTVSEARIFLFCQAFMETA
jgi:hypothetical protein